MSKSHPHPTQPKEPVELQVLYILSKDPDAQRIHILLFDIQAPDRYVSDELLLSVKRKYSSTGGLVVLRMIRGMP